MSKDEFWIEHRATDRHGKVPEWFKSTDELGNPVDPSLNYWRRIQWSRSQFTKHHRYLVETFNYQWTEGTLIGELRRLLEERRVNLSELSTDEVVRRAYGLLPKRNPMEDLAFSFINKAKSSGLGIDDVKAKTSRRALDRRQKAFLDLIIPLWREYESFLKTNEMLDFNDMITLGLEVAKQELGKNHLDDYKYSHILIDEFQDITDTQLEFVKYLLNNGDDTHLFCVGDDWQNIFSFAGSNVNNILQFEKQFPFAEKSEISTNYRCPKNITEASNYIISLNKFQTKKVAIPYSKFSSPIVLVEMPDNLPGIEYERWELAAARNLVKNLIEKREQGDKLLVPVQIRRTNFFS